MSHTPGPWTVSDVDPHVVGAVRLVRFQITGQDVPQLQAVARVLERTGETEANARLIAAAPALYEALKDCCAALGGVKRNPDKIPMSARLALAKAEGR